MTDAQFGEKETVFIRCDECGSQFRAQTSSMRSLCPECAHILYGYPNCRHEFTAGCCKFCGWDGSTSEYLQRLKA
ncbi:MAG TPA: hypothetical protein V6D19_17980 [Stenomitos sp.]